MSYPQIFAEPTTTIHNINYKFLKKNKERKKEKKEMTCLEPITAYQRQIYPISAGKDEHMLKKLKKISFKYIKGWKQITLPCGKCLGCRLDHANMWATRISLETKYWKNNCFITLTYNDKGYRKTGERNLPLTKGGIPTLLEKDVQCFLKRLRKAHKGIEEWINPKNGKKEKPIRYFYVGEYGSRSGRPHYHILLLNWKPDDLKQYKKSPGSNEMLYTSKEIEKLWGFGFAPIGTVTYESACYVARYVQKKAYKEPDKKEYTDEIQPDGTIKRKEIKNPYKPTPEYIRMSRGVGLGVQEWENKKKIIKEQNGVLVKTKNVVLKPIPRYFKKLWETEDMSEFDTSKYKNNIKNQKLEKERLKSFNFTQNKLGWDEITKYLERLQNKEILEEKAKYLKRNL